MDERDPVIERVVAEMKRPVRLDPDLDRRVMAAIERGGGIRAVVQWLKRRRTVSVSPLGGLGFATAVVALLLIQQWWLAATPETTPPAVASAQERDVVQFVFVAPGASEVALVGDFNDWSLGATPMRTVPGNGMWTVTVPLSPGRYRYAFVVDDTTWVRDPSAPPAIESDFGRPNSVLTVRGS